jgi:hypothetical protein
MNKNGKFTLEQAADKVNDAVEEIALAAADAAIEPDPVHVAGTTNEQMYLPEVSAPPDRPEDPWTADARPQSPKKEETESKNNMTAPRLRIRRGAPSITNTRPNDASQSRGSGGTRLYCAAAIRLWRLNTRS